MKETTATIRLFSVSKFGYFPLKGQEGAAKKATRFGTLADTLQDLATWSRKLTLGMTATREQREGHLNVFCKGVARAGDDWVLSLVQQAPTSAGGVLHFDLSSKVGAVKVSSTPVAEGRVAGWATHYWFLPTEDKVATVKLDESPPSRDKMLQYVKGFMAREAPNVQQHADGSLLYTHEGKEPLACQVKFEIGSGRDGEAEKRVLAGEVRRIIFRETVPLIQPRKSKRAGLLSYFGPLMRTLPTIAVGVDEARVEARIVKSLTKAEAKRLIDGWHREEDPWANLGFEVWIDERWETHWLERERSTAKVVLNVQEDGHGVINLESLAEALHQRRSAIFESLRSTS